MSLTLCQENTPVGGRPNKRPELQSAFGCHDVIMAIKQNVQDPILSTWINFNPDGYM